MALIPVSLLWFTAKFLSAFWQSCGHIPNKNFLPQYLSCLTTSRSLTDKLAFDVGLQEDSTGKTKHGNHFSRHN